ncbi:MAG: methyltransferase domain-containing protein [Promicromonosporaceae bacterium]|nr:methyltransferase domain-containing protein [Promicromonosporaceae bacterium]
MRAARTGSLVGSAALVVLLAALAAATGLSPVGWAVGLVCAAVVVAVEVRGLSRYAHARGPADMITLTRAILTCGVAALVAESFLRTPPVGAIVALTVPALALDAVDGWVARRTRTASLFGAWFDGEVDAFLMLVLSVGVVRSAGAWVLAIGGVRYAFGLAGRGLPWLRAPLPPRYWRKVVTATAGIVLAAAVAGVAPSAVTEAALAVVLALLAESFGRDVLWLWSRRAATRALAAPGDGHAARDRLERALVRARPVAYEPGEFVGQESFMGAEEILALAARAGIGRGTSVLDLCCGVAGPGRLITRALGCTYLGVDSSAAAVTIARERAGEDGCRFEVAAVPPVPVGAFDVVLLFETLLAFPDKEALLREVSASLPPGGRFAFTVEEGAPLTRAERSSMPRSDTVWPVPLPELLGCLERVGLRVTWQEERSHAHRAVAHALARAFADDAPHITAHLGRRALDDLVTSHRLWGEWLQAGRIRKFAFVTEKTP